MASIDTIGAKIKKSKQNMNLQLTASLSRSRRSIGQLPETSNHNLGVSTYIFVGGNITFTCNILKSTFSFLERGWGARVGQRSM